MAHVAPIREYHEEQADADIAKAACAVLAIVIAIIKPSHGGIPLEPRGKSQRNLVFSEVLGFFPRVEVNFHGYYCAPNNWWYARVIPMRETCHEKHSEQALTDMFNRSRSPWTSGLPCVGAGCLCWSERELLGGGGDCSCQSLEKPARLRQP